MRAPRVAELGEQFADYEVQEHALRLGMWAFLGSEALLFAGLFTLYACYRVMYGADFVAAARHNTIVYGTVNTYVLLTSSLTVAASLWAIRQARRPLALVLLAGSMLLGVTFLALKLAEYREHIHEGALPGPYYHLHELPTFGANRFYTLYWVMTGLHALHVVAGLCILGWLAFRTVQGRYSPARHVGFEMGTLYWHLVDVVWIFLWPMLYLM